MLIPRIMVIALMAAHIRGGQLAKPNVAKDPQTDPEPDQINAVDEASKILDRVEKAEGFYITAAGYVLEVNPKNANAS